MTTTTTFQTGKTYEARSAMDSNCIWRVFVERRTAKSLFVSVDGEPVKRIAVRTGFGGHEYASPLGTGYSMAPTISSERSADEPAPADPEQLELFEVA